MTIDAARGHIGYRVVRFKGTDRAEEGVIAFTGGRLRVRPLRRRRDEYRDRPG